MLMETSIEENPAPEDVAEVLARNAMVVTAVLTRLGAAHDLSLTQLRVLGILRDRMPRMAALADFLGLEKSTMSGLIARAERRGLVRREPDPEDARATCVVMTPTGRQLADQVGRELRSALESMTGRLSSEEADQLGALLQKMMD